MASACAVVGCERRLHAHGLCGPHLYRQSKYGDPLHPGAGRDPKLCAVNGCVKPARSRGWCHAHYNRYVLYGNPLGTGRPQTCMIAGCHAPHRARGYCAEHLPTDSRNADPVGARRKRQLRTCTVAGCDEYAYGLGYCHDHYWSMRRYGDPLKAQRRIVHKVGEYLAPEDGYTVIKMPGHPNARRDGSVREHIYVMSQILGRGLRPGETVHHRNGLKADNRPENLELWSGNHGTGQRVSEKIAWCLEFLAQYADQPVLWPQGSAPVLEAMKKAGAWDLDESAIGPNVTDAQTQALFAQAAALGRAKET